MTKSAKRIILVTGASRGIGRAAALAIAKSGAHVIAAARSEKALTTLDDEIKAATGDTATLIPLDLRDFASVDRLAGVLLQRYGQLDGLLGAAGVLGNIGPLQMDTPTTFTETIETNLSANWRLIRAVHPLLAMSPAGRALFITSGAAINHRAYWGPYAASKAGLEAMVMCYADEIEKTSIRVNLYDPGATATQMRFKAMPGEDQSTLPTPEQVARPMPFYLSEECDVHGTRVSYRALAQE
jgi:NAD(P)-dependent dehydrogenase (short-subunit alcohol dehydrogenase family)